MESEELIKLKELSLQLESSELISIEENNVDECLELAEYLDIKEMVESVLNYTGITISQNQQKFAYLTGATLDWVCSKNEDWLYGGYSMTLFRCLAYPSHFWKIYNDPPESAEQQDFLEDLVYFQKSGHGDDGTFGCFPRNQDFDKNIIFYDSGCYFKMSIGLEEYMEALLKYKAVCAWQYFFIEPQLIIKNLKDISAENWAITSIDYDNSRFQGSKVNAVLFHMDKIIRLFPKLFPDVDLSEAIAQRDKLAALLEK